MTVDESAFTGLAAAIGASGGLTGHGATGSGGSATLSAGASLTATSSSVSGMSATLSQHEFRDLSVAAGRAALARLEAKTGTDPRDIFAEIGEVLGWLYALGDVDKGRNRMHAGLRWARFMHAHGSLLTEAMYYDHGAVLGHFVLGKTPLGAKPQYRWLTRDKIVRRKEARHLETAYDDDIADKPVLDALRDELNRLAALPGSDA